MATAAKTETTIIIPDRQEIDLTGKSFSVTAGVAMVEIHHRSQSIRSGYAVAILHPGSSFCGCNVDKGFRVVAVGTLGPCTIEVD